MIKKIFLMGLSIVLISYCNGADVHIVQNRDLVEYVMQHPDETSLRISFAESIRAPHRTEILTQSFALLSRNNRTQHIKELDLSNNQLITPPLLMGISHLESLDLSNNELATPPILGAMTFLGNRITELQANIRLLALDLHNNKLTFPPVLTRVPRLRQLDLSNNLLATLPVLNDLPDLQRVNLSNNKYQLYQQLAGAAAEGDLLTVQQLANQGLNVGANKNEALKESAGKGHLPVVRYLLNAQSSQEEQVFKNAWSDALLAAASEGQEEVVRFLTTELLQGWNKQSILKALRQSAANGHVPVVRYLIEQLSQDPARYLLEEDSNEETLQNVWGVALGAAVSGGQAEVVRFLVTELPEGFDEEAVGELFIEFAAGANTERVKILLTELPNYWPDAELLNEAARWAATDNNVDLLRYYLIDLPEDKRPHAPVLDQQFFRDVGDGNASLPVDAVKFLVTELPANSRANVHAFENPALWEDIVGFEGWVELFRFVLTELPQDQQIQIPVLDSAFINGIDRGHCEEAVNFFMSLPERYRPSVQARNQALQMLEDSYSSIVLLLQQGADWTLLNPAQQAGVQQYILTQLQPELSNRNWPAVEQLLSALLGSAVQQDIQDKVMELLIPAVQREIQGIQAVRGGALPLTIQYRILGFIIGPTAYRYYYNLPNRP